MNSLHSLARSALHAGHPAQPRLHPCARLLVTLLLTNAVAMEALPIFLDRLLNPFAAVILSVTAVLMFGKAGQGVHCSKGGGGDLIFLEVARGCTAPGEGGI